MTNSISKAAAKAASDREKAITRTIKRMAAMIDDLAASGTAADVASAARCRAMIGRSVDLAWRIVGTDGHIALLGAGAGDGTSIPLLRDAVQGPAVPLPGAFRPALKRVLTCADLGAKASPIAGGVRIAIEAERLTLSTACAETSAREWMPGDGRALAGRHVALSGRYLREAVDVVGVDGSFGLCAAKHVNRSNRTIEDGVTYEPGPAALVSADRLWAVVVMGLVFARVPKSER